MKRGDLVTIALQGDYGKPRPAVVVQSDFYSRCIELLGDSLRYRELRACGLAYAETKSWSSVNGFVIDLYQKMVDRSKSNAGLEEVVPFADNV